MDARMTRFGRMTWHSSARLIALSSWAIAIALTGSLGWQAWTSVQATTGQSHFGSTQIDTALIAPQILSDAQIIAEKNWVVR